MVPQLQSRETSRAKVRRSLRINDAVDTKTAALERARNYIGACFKKAIDVFDNFNNGGDIFRDDSIIRDLFV